MNKPISVTFTSNDICRLQDVGEGIDNMQENIAKCEAVASIFTEALERCDECGTEFCGNILIGVANVLLDYSQKASEIGDKTRQQLSDLYSVKRDKSYVEGGDGNE